MEAYKLRYKNKLKIDLSKNEIVGYRKITELIFGTHHPYGYNSTEETIEALNRSDILEHHQRCYNASNCKIFLSGKTTPEMIELINESFGKLPKGSIQEPNFPDKSPVHVRHVSISNKDSLQTSIRIGRKMFNQKHRDFAGMSVLNTVLGGYFGSRLMTNIREEKGYTYNIYSMLDNFIHDGYFYIGAEVGNDFVQSTLKEITRELLSLQEELIEEEELSMVKNYLLGTYLTVLDGPFNASEVVRNLIIEEVSVDEFNNIIKAVKEISAEELQALAVQYFNPEQMWQVIVGN